MDRRVSFWAASSEFRVILQQAPGTWGQNSYPQGCDRSRVFRHVFSKNLYLTFTEEAEQFLGMSMTYSLFEWVRESLETLLEKQPETIQTICEEVENKCSVTENDDEETTAKTKVKKEQLTKAQKRAQWKKGGVNEEDRERGWNWVDIVRHLSQTRDTD